MILAATGDRAFPPSATCSTTFLPPPPTKNFLLTIHSIPNLPGWLSTKHVTIFTRYAHPGLSVFHDPHLHSQAKSQKSFPRFIKITIIFSCTSPTDSTANKDTFWASRLVPAATCKKDYLHTMSRLNSYAGWLHRFRGRPAPKQRFHNRCCAGTAAFPPVPNPRLNDSLYVKISSARHAPLHSGSAPAAIVHTSKYYLVVRGVNPVRTAVPFWGQTSQILSGLSPKRDCGSNGVKLLL